MKTLAIKEIYQEDPRTLCIHWNNDKQLFYDVVELRRLCPCALCVDEKTGKRTLKPESISDKVRPIKIDSVGTYAINIVYDDGHKTGLYTFEKLEKQGSPSTPLP